MKILVTGANGFVGKAIVFELLKGPHELVLLDRMKSSDAEHPDLKFAEADISNTDELRKLDIDSVDVVIHAAGLAHQFGPVTKDTFWKVNVEGTSNIAELAIRAGARYMILISSVSVYGKAGDGVSLRTEDAECVPEGFYAESKLESETAARQICKDNGLSLTILRLATVIGEGDRGNVYRLIRAIDRNRFLWIGKGENRKSLIYKGDVARACSAVLAAEPGSTRVYNVSASPATMKEIVEYIGNGLNKKPLGVSIPSALLRAGLRVNASSIGVKSIERLGNTVEKWLADDTYSAARIAAECGFVADSTVEQAIAIEVAWYLKNR